MCPRPDQASGLAPDARPQPHLADRKAPAVNTDLYTPRRACGPPWTIPIPRSFRIRPRDHRPGTPSAA
jgi:hypothetical protein